MRPDREERCRALVAFDNGYRSKYGMIAGMDEAGRGPLCGKVVAACVVMPENSALEWVDDSKKLSEKRREELFESIYAEALYVGVGKATPEEIDRINILEATKLAMRRAAGDCPAGTFLIDAVRDIGLKGKEIPIIRGDAQSYSIAAASIIAKVTRDREMRDLSLQYPGFGFERNKGYGTAEHIAALRKLGPTPIHRKTFIGHFVEDV